MARIERCTSAAILIAIFAVTAGRGDSSFAQDSCAQIATPAERLACYDRLVPPPEPAPPSPVVPSVSPDPIPAEQPRTVAAATPAGGAENQGSPAVPVVVIGMRKYPGRSATFTTDNGDVWVQIGAEGVYLPKVPFKAELRPASMGTYFLRPADYGWRVHVRRNE